MGVSRFAQLPSGTKLDVENIVSLSSGRYVKGILQEEWSFTVLYADHHFEDLVYYTEEEYLQDMKFLRKAIGWE